MTPPKIDPKVEETIQRVKMRLQKSVSGYVRATKFGLRDRTALKALIGRGEVEMFTSPIGSAYRLTK